MNNAEEFQAADAGLFRSPLIVDRKTSGLIVVDVQEKLFPLILNHAEIQWNIERIVAAATALGVRISVTEQYPQGLGATIGSLQSKLPSAFEKRMFSCRECIPLLAEWLNQGIRQAVVVGIETHVCVLQSALDLQSMGFDVFVVADAVGSRAEIDRSVALNRLSQSGVTIATTESVLFEWCETSAADEFKQISRLVRSTSPQSAPIP